MKRDKLIMVIIFAFVLIMTACGKRNDSKVGDEKNNSEADLVYIDYADAESFEAVLNEGEDLEGKIVQFEALELHPDSAVGYNVWAYILHLHAQPLLSVRHNAVCFPYP